MTIKKQTSPTLKLKNLMFVAAFVFQLQVAENVFFSAVQFCLPQFFFCAAIVLGVLKL